MGWKKFGSFAGKAALQIGLQQVGAQGLVNPPSTKRNLCKRLAQSIAVEYELDKTVRNEVFRGLVAYVDGVEDALEALSQSDLEDDWEEDENEDEGTPTLGLSGA